MADFSFSTLNISSLCHLVFIVSKSAASFLGGSSECDELFFSLIAFKILSVFVFSALVMMYLGVYLFVLIYLEC